MAGNALAWFGRALILLAGIVAIAGIIGLGFVVSEIDETRFPSGQGQEQVRTLLELGSLLIIAVGVLIGVGVYCIAATRRAPELP